MMLSKYIKNIERKNFTRGAHPAHEGGGAPYPLDAPLPRGPPGGPPMPIFCYMESFVEEKIISKLSGRDSAATRRNLGGANLGFWWGCSAGETSFLEGEIIAIIITIDPLIERGSISINILPTPSPLKP